MKSVIFCRVSSKEQEETGYSLPAQEKYLREYADKNSLDVIKVFAVSESASGSVQRKVFNQMVDYIRKNKISVVTVETTDRLTRNFADVPAIDKWILEDDSHQIHLAKEGCTLHKDSKSHEWFMWRVKVATAEYYVRLLSENVKKGQKEKISQGWLPTKPPLGYVSIGEKGHKIHMPDEKVSALIKRMFELYATGNYSLLKLTKQMYEEGLRTDSGKQVVKSRIHRLLNDPFYIGKIRWNDEVYPGKQEPLITEEIFYKVQSLLKSKNTPKYRKHNNIFKALIRCKECGGTITWETHKNRVYGHCNHYRNCTQKTWSLEQEVETQLIDKFESLEIKNPRIVEWIRKALKEGHQDQIAYYSSVVGELQQKHNLLKKRLDALYVDKLDGNITQQDYSHKSKEWSVELDKINQTIEKHNHASGKYYQLGINIYELSQHAKQIYLKAKNKEDRRSLINLVFSKLTLDKGRLEVEYSKTFKLLSEAVTLTNSSKVKKLPKIKTETFEPLKKTDVTRQSAFLYSSRPNWLPNPSFNINDSIRRLIDIVEEIGVAGRLTGLSYPVKD